MIKVELVIEDREHDVAVLRATPNPFGKAYRVNVLSPDAATVQRGESIVVAALRPKRRQPRSYETELRIDRRRRSSTFNRASSKKEWAIPISCSSITK